ncbi:unnamed protein product, partial [Coccothraustes coccothraustes]
MAGAPPAAPRGFLGAGRPPAATDAPPLAPPLYKGRPQRGPDRGRRVSRTDLRSGTMA